MEGHLNIASVGKTLLLIIAAVGLTSNTPVRMVEMVQPSYSQQFVEAPAMALESPTEPTPSPREPREYLRDKASAEPGIGLLLSEVIDRESNWAVMPDGTIDYARCNEAFGCGAGKGLIMLIESTAAYCSKKLGREIDRGNPYDAIDCGWQLLTENGPRKGIGHWDDFGKPLNGKRWGTGPYNLQEFGL